MIVTSAGMKLLRPFLAFLVVLFLATSLQASNTPDSTVPPPPAASLSAEERKTLIDSLDYVVAPSLFDGDVFPKGAFRNGVLVERYFGKIAASTVYYTADFTRVEKPGAPGRYGAVTTLRFPTGEVVERRQTLCRLAQWIDRHAHPLDIQVTLPDVLGGAASNQPAVGEWFSRTMADARGRGGDTAVLFAWLTGVPAGAPPLPDRLGPAASDEQWWYELRSRLHRAPTYVYLLHLPGGYEGSGDAKWPLLLFLHGSGERGSDLELVKKNGPPKQIAEGRDLPFIVVSPQCPDGEWWNPSVLNALLDEVGAKLRIDPDRIYVTGLSMGGFATWQLGLRTPERFAAIVPVCGGGDPRDAARLRSIPIWAFHGADDPVVNPDLSRRMVAAVQDSGGNAKLTLYPGTGHESWVKAYAEPDLYPWLLSQKRRDEKR